LEQQPRPDGGLSWLPLCAWSCLSPRSRGCPADRAQLIARS